MANGGNGYDRVKLEGLLVEIDAADERLASLKGEYMESCKGPRNDIEAVFAAAKEQGFPMRAFKTFVKNRRLDRQQHANLSRLDLAQQAEYAQLADAFGSDTPFGQYAARRAGGEDPLAFTQEENPLVAG